MAAQPLANCPIGDDWLYELRLDSSPRSLGDAGCAASVSSASAARISASRGGLPSTRST